MKAEIKFTEDGELFVGYENDFEHPLSKSDFEQCENVEIERFKGSHATIKIDGKSYDIEKCRFYTNWGSGYSWMII